MLAERASRLVLCRQRSRLGLAHRPAALAEDSQIGNRCIFKLALCAGMMCRGQLGNGHLTDFALTSGKPTGVWHANRLMSLFKCKFVGDH